MGIFSKLFPKKKENINSIKGTSIKTSIEEIESFLSTDAFLAKKEFNTFFIKYIPLKDELQAVQSASMVDEYCKKNGVSKNDVERFLSFYQDKDLRQKHNDKYITKVKEQDKDYLDHILDECDTNIHLDDDQRNVIISDEDNTLVIAGAGAGKTTTVAAKVKYIVDKKNIESSKILVISFTNKAVDELKDRINKALSLPCDISTFHSVGASIINKDNNKKVIVEDSFLYNSIRDYLKTRVLSDEVLAQKVLLFFAGYLKLPPSFKMPLNELFAYTAKNDFVTLKGDIEAYAEKVNKDRQSGKKPRTITNECVASYQEMQIANFLYINGIDYKYEDHYEYHIKGASQIYTPDFHLFQNDKSVYLEHFGLVSDTGTNFNRSQAEIDAYIKKIRDKIALHKKHGTTLLKTFGEYADGRDLLTHLKEELVKAGFTFNPRSRQEILSKILSTEQNLYVDQLIRFLMNFVSAFKTNGYSHDHFMALRGAVNNERDRLFLEIAEGAYSYYQNELKSKDSIDFADMINESVLAIQRMQKENAKLDYQYIIVDEYQDISHQRYNLTSELSKICDAKIVAVGDDWQSIYAFSGSDITLFTEFKKNIPDKSLGCQLLYINNTYRNAQELIDTAGRFVQKNNTQLRKSLKSPKSLEDPVIIYSYTDDSQKIKEMDLKSPMYQKVCALEEVLTRIVEEDPSVLDYNREKAPILLIGRFNYDAERLTVGSRTFKSFGLSLKDDEPEFNLFTYDEPSSRVISKKYPSLKIVYMTAHSSKGLTFDHTVIINGLNGTYGFPSKINDDPIMDLVVRRDRAIEYAEERRLFYVALTRTKNRVYILSPETRPSEFVTELIVDKGYKNITVWGSFNEKKAETIKYHCPECGFPMKQRLHDYFNEPLYICTNERELCGFMTNDLSGGRMRILKCPDCISGYLFVKKKKGDAGDRRFLGCSNYKEDGTGCNHTLTRADFDKLYPKESNLPYYEEKSEDKGPLLVYKGSKETMARKPEVKQIIKEKKQSIDDYQKNLSELKKYLIDKHPSLTIEDKNFSSHFSFDNKVLFYTDLKRNTFVFKDPSTGEKGEYPLTKEMLPTIQKKVSVLIDGTIEQSRRHEEEELQLFKTCLSEISDYLKRTSSILKRKESDKAISYTDKESGEMVFLIHKEKRSFTYYPSENGATVHLPIVLNNLCNIRKVIDEDIKVRKAKQKEEAKLVKEINVTSHKFSDQVKDEDKEFIKQLMSALKEYDSSFYLTYMYGIPFIRVKHSFLPLCWFFYEDDKFVIKVGKELSENGKKEMYPIDIDDMESVFAFIISLKEKLIKLKKKR